MGFYGNINNTTKVQFNFDRIFSSRYDMDTAAEEGVDGVFAGRFVLVSYEKEVRNFPICYLKNNKLYTNRDATTELTFPARTIVRVPLNYNLDNTTQHGYFKINENGVPVFLMDDEISSEVDFPIYYFNNDKLYINQEDATAETNPVLDLPINTTIHIPLDYDISPVQASEKKNGYYKIDGITNEGIVTISLITPNTDVSNPYLINYLLDTQTYGNGRGYDGTVWQKMYAENRSYFAMVAELNSIVPTLAITADAPTKIPTAPHFDVDTSNVYYKLHIQSMPSAWLKPANSNIGWTIGTDIPDETTGIPTTLNRNYPSDVDYSYPQVQLDGSISYNSQPAAVYFNKAGFNPDTISYSDDTISEDTNHIWYDIGDEDKDKITIDLNGMSGQLYGTDGSISQTPQPDTYELAIMLPSIGDTMAKVWDLIYGGREVAVLENHRRKEIEWLDAALPQPRNGLRLTAEATTGGIGYEPNQVNTVAGSINTMHDLIGMIIINATGYDLTNEQIMQGADVDKIYWQNDKYYRVGIDYDPQYDEEDASKNKDVRPHFEPTNLNEPRANTYFEKYGDNYLLVRNTSDFKKNKKYYAWSNLSTAFIQADVFGTEYQKNKYYYQDGDDYFLDTSDTPTPGRTYLDIPKTGWLKPVGDRSVIWYQKNRFYKKQKVNGEFTGNIIWDGEAGTDWDQNNTTDRYDLFLIDSEAYTPGMTDAIYVNVTNRVRKLDEGGPYYTYDVENNAYRKIKSDIYADIWSNDGDGSTSGSAGQHTLSNISSISLIVYTLDEQYRNNITSLYAPNTYWYINDPVTTENTVNSLEIVDDNDQPIRVIGDILKDMSLNKIEGRTYFTKRNDVDAELMENPFYIANEYYLQSNASGAIEGDDDTDPPTTYALTNESWNTTYHYYERFDKHVIEDSNNIFPIYYKWNPNIVVPNGVQLCWLKDKQIFEELEGYARDKNTLNGWLLETHKKFGVENTRDINTVNGAINTLQDLTNNFATMQVGESVIIDSYGRLHSAEVNGDYWIDVDLDYNINDPSITITHNQYAVTPTTSQASLSATDSTSTFTVPTYSFDEAGHYNGLDTKTLTMPNNYGIITGDNAGVFAEASASHDTLAINGDSWLTSTITADTVTITHNAPQTAQSITLTETSANNVTPAFGATFDIADWTFDSNGHMAGGTKHTVTVPDLSVTDTIANGNVLTGLSYTNGSGTFTTARANLGNIALGSYEAPASGGSGNITTTTTLAQAIAALDGRIGTSINNLTYAGESEPAANSFVTEVTQTNGVISVTKSIISLSNIVESTTPQLVSYNNQGIVTGGSALTWDTMKNLEVGRDNNEAIITFDNLVRYLLQLHETALTKTLTSIAVTTLPNVVTYTEGDRLSLTGMRITGTYTQGADTTYELIETGYTVSPEGNAELSVNGSSTPVTIPVTVTYQGKTATFNVTVNPKVMTGIEITQEPTTMNYTDRKTLDLDGLVVTASFNDNSTRPLNTSEYVTDPVEGATLTSGDVTVLVSVPNTEFTDSFTVHVE